MIWLIIQVIGKKIKDMIFKSLKKKKEKFIWSTWWIEQLKLKGDINNFKESTKPKESVKKNTTKKHTNSPKCNYTS